MRKCGPNGEPLETINRRPPLQFRCRWRKYPSPQRIEAQSWPIREKPAMRMIQQCLILAAAFSALTFGTIVRAEQIVVSNYGIAANGMPYAVAMEKGFFKQEGADVSGILSSSGGGTTIRNLLGGNLSYG